MAFIKPFFHHDTKTFTYIVHDQTSKDAVVIDPVVDFDPETFAVSYTALDHLCDYLKEAELRVQLIIDTHVHADHLTGTAALKKRHSTKAAIGEGFFVSQEYFSHVYELDPKDYLPAYDKYLNDETFSCGSLTIKAIPTPGHTPTCTALLIDDAIFVGDTLFQPYLGCGRTDFPAGSAAALYRSIKNKLYTLPDHYRIFVGHDYPKDDLPPHAETTVGDSKRSNSMINETTLESTFIKERQARDKTLTPPHLLPYAMQVNILGGQLPKKGPHDRPFLFMPVTIP